MSESTTRSGRSTSPKRGDDLWLVVSSEAGLSTMRLPNREAIVIGRAEGSDVVIDDPSVSRRHAELRGLELRDLGSRNGTVVGSKHLGKNEATAMAIGVAAELGSVTLVLVRGRPHPRANRDGDGDGDHRDPTMKHLYGLLDLVGPSDLSVLVLGETGVGKEIFAETVHARSQRVKAPFLRINCAGLGGSLLDAELFGYERGAFTGALAAKAGLFEAAHGGTMLLDEVGELPLETQAKVLRVLDSGEVYRLGSVTPRRVDVRYIAATNRDLDAAVAGGTFRQDLFFRLNGFSVTLPPLRRRTSEILPLAEEFLARCAARSGGPPTRLDEEAARTLVGHPFPGNVRELRQLIERAFVLANGSAVVTSAHLALPGIAARPKKGRTIDLDRGQIATALRAANGNQSRAAEILGVARRTLINRLEEFGLDRPRKKTEPPKG